MRSVNFLLDTNIIIYLLLREKKYVDFLAESRDKKFGISVASLMEVLVGVNDANEGRIVASELSQFEIIPIDKAIGLETAEILRVKKAKNLKDTRFIDIIIAQTAIGLGIPLITNNPKDFKLFRKLKVITP